MVRWNNRVSRRGQAVLGGALLFAIGVAGGAGAESLARPTVEMAPTVPTAIARLAQAEGVVTVKGRVAEVYGNRFVVQDASGRTLVDAGHGGGRVARGAPVMVQGRFRDGQLHASYLVDGQGRVEAVGGPPPHGPDRHGPGHGPDDAPPPPPPGGPDAAPGIAPPPPPGGPGMPPPPPPGGPAGAGRVTPPPPGGAGAPPPPSPIANGAALATPASAPTPARR